MRSSADLYWRPAWVHAMADSLGKSNPTPNQNVAPAPAETGTCSTSPSVAACESSDIEPPRVTDVPIRRPGFPWLLPVAAGFAGGFGAVICNLAGVGSKGRLFVFGLLMLGSQVLIYRFAGKSMERRVKRMPSRGDADDIATVVGEATERPTWSVMPRPAGVLAKELARRGRLGETIRLQLRGGFEPVEPLTMVFEPRLLDQADPGFEELLSAASPMRDPSGTPSLTHLVRDDVFHASRVRRNVSRAGGWPVIIFLGFMFVSLYAYFLVHRQITILELAIGAALLTLMLYSPVGGAWFGTRHWLFAPSSLIVRKARWRDRASQLHLFNRRKSVLCLYRPAKKGEWTVAVADGEASEQITATDAEVSLLLRAWLSTIEPPPVERLSDLC